jgi:DNA polymerase elongation subunit (family B)
MKNKTLDGFYTDVQVVGNSIYYRGVSKDGSACKHRIPWRPTLFLPTKNETDWRTIDGKNVAPTCLGDIRETRDFIRNHEGVAGFAVYGNTRLQYNFIAEQFSEDIIEWDIDKVQVANIDIEVISKSGFPNPDKAEFPIVSITSHGSKVDKYTIFGLKEYDISKCVMETSKGNVKLDVEYRRYDSEIELLLAFLEYWSKELEFPNIVTGWNIKTFDIPYIVNRMRRLLGEETTKKLSPWSMVKEDSGYFMDRPYEGYSIVGVAQIDYLELYWKFATKQSESWKLDFIANAELGERKLSYEEFSGLPELYEKDHQKFISYNLRDVWLVREIDKSKQLMFLALMLAYDSHTNYEDVFAQVTMWDQICNRALLKKKIAIPPKIRRDKKEQYVGAYVKDPKPGLYKWIISLDLDSLYPHLMMQYNISPDTIIEPEKYSPEMRRVVGAGVTVDKLLNQQIDLSWLGKQKVTMTPNGQFFRTDKHGFLPELMESMYADRSKYKKLMLELKSKAESETNPEIKNKLKREAERYNVMQNVKKVCLNSAYGAIGNEYFRFFDIRQAEGITTGGQLSIRWVANRLNDYLNKVLKTNDYDYVIASDTDSVYLELDGVVKSLASKIDKDKIVDTLDKYCNSIIQPIIDKCYANLALYVNAYEQKMRMKRESIADKGIWTASKRYILRIHDKEGVRYAKPKIAITGLEVIKSNTPASCRSAMLEAIDLIMSEDEGKLHAFTDSFRKKFVTLPVDDIAFPTGVRGLFEYSDNNTIYGKKTPAHTKAALLYNHKLKQMGLETKYPLIPEGEKIKWIYLKKNNPIGDTVIAFMDIMPEEFDLERHYDKSTQFQKAFVDKLEIITRCIGWNVEKTAKLDI